MCNVNVFRIDATIFTVTLASIYIVYLTWSAMASNYDESCQLNMNDSTNTILQIIVGLIFAFVTIVSIALAYKEQVSRGESKTLGEDIIAENVSTDAKPKTKEDEDAMLFPITIATVIFQFIMVLCTLYFGMVFSNWGDAVIAGDND